MPITFQPINDASNTQLEAIINSLLQGAGVSLVSGSIVYIGVGNQGSTFSDGAAAVGLSTGLLLTSGSGSPAAANTVPNFTRNWEGPSDADLTAAAGAPTYDSNTFRFQVLVTNPSVTSLTFSLVFASEEYPEFVNSFADIAVVMGNGVNRATFGNGAPLAVNSNNLGFFQRNTTANQSNGVPPPGPVVQLPIEYDGVSRVFTVNVPVTQGVNTIKFGVGDTRDGSLDSGLFIGSIVAGNAPIQPIASGSTLAIAPAQITQLEGDSGARVFSYTVTRTGDTFGTSSVNWAVTGSQVNAADFVGGVLPSGVLTFAPGQTTRVIEVLVNGDIAVEPTEAFDVTLSAPVNATLTTAVASGTIVNDDTQATLSIGPAALSRVEGDTGSQVFSYTVTRTGDTTGTSSVIWSVTGSTANPANAADFVGGVLPSGVLTFAPGQTSRVIEVLVNGDRTVEQDENFDITLSAPVNAVVAVAAGRGTVLNDDLPPPTLNIGPATISQVEGDAGARIYIYTVTRAGDLTVASTVNWGIDGFGANPADSADFLAGLLPSGALSFAAGEVSKTIEIRVNGDTLFEASEQFRVSLTGPNNATIGATGQVIGVIVNDDLRAISPLIIPQALVQTEGGAGQQTVFAFTVLRFGDLSQAASGTWTIGAPASGPAASSADFLATSGGFSFAAGAATAQVLVTVIGDSAPEAAEGFEVLVNMPGFAALVGRGLIVNDDVATAAAFFDPLDEQMAFGAGAVDAWYGAVDSYPVQLVGVDDPGAGLGV